MLTGERRPGPAKDSGSKPYHLKKWNLEPSVREAIAGHHYMKMGYTIRILVSEFEQDKICLHHIKIRFFLHFFWSLDKSTSNIADLPKMAISQQSLGNQHC